MFLTARDGVDDLTHLAHRMEHALQEHHGLELLVLGSQHAVLFATPRAGFTVERVARMISDMLLLAKAENGLALTLPHGA
ncbi:MAG: hypothetical protein KBF98_08750 [Rhodoferax sp.]|nr:hypothetical protein [Rhodoferax sp.]MBP9060391.1 hypothetical protein [Rhodoferax sp.]